MPKSEDNRGNNKERKQRTILLVKKSIKELVRNKEKVTLKAIEDISKTVDVEGRGICHTAITGNEEAHRLYKEAATHVKSRSRGRALNFESELEGHTTVRDLRAKKRRMLRNYRKIELVDLIFYLSERYDHLQLAHIEVSSRLIDELSE